ncbi:MAG: ATP-grasp domain-containing protein [Ramlibacter sp.]|nr:ATP-grasp domain-containing protein [Ramlibacter sp.]
MKILALATNRGAQYRLLALGHEVTLLATLPFGIAADFKSGYGNLVYLGAEAGDDAFRALAASLHAVCGFDLVHSFHDNYQVLAADIAADLGVGCRHKKEATRLAVDKARTRERIRQAGVSTLGYSRVESLDQLRAVLGDMKFPVMAKPLEGTASKGVVKLDSMADLVPALQDSLPMIVEPFIEGREFSVESFSEDGTHRILAVTEKFKADDSFVEIGHLVPARIDAASWRRICAYATAVLDALEIENGPCHTEVMVSGEQVELIETHTRTGGDEIPNLVRLACGLDLYDLEARQMTGERVLPSIPEDVAFPRHAAIWYLVPNEPRPRTLLEVDGVEDARAVPSVKSVKVEKMPGAIVHTLGYSFDRGAHVIAVDTDGDSALASARAAVKQLRFRLE